MKTRNSQQRRLPAKGFGYRGNQQGAVLVFCLVFLVVLTMMAVTGMETSILEERMSGNLRDQSSAFQAAESALKVAENWLDDQIELPDTSSNGSTTVWVRDSMDPNPSDSLFWWQGSSTGESWWNTNAEALSGFSVVNSQPQYIIEHLLEASVGQSIAIGNGEIPLPRVFHRITSRAEGATGSAEVTLQSTFVKYYE
ncbi:MAG: PilX N-terminal domain-containing pilus assembly protein [Gammaproteobacteria bacterium]|jgi:type IV pilus assembly protein PilX